MAQHSDGSGNDAANVNFLIGLLAGTALGAGLALLLAPKPGAQLRGDIRKRAEDTADSLRDAARRSSVTFRKARDRRRGEPEPTKEP
jgi:gas vesicle protein